MEQMKIQYEAELAQVRSQLEQMGGVVDSEKAKIRSEFEQTIGMDPVSLLLLLWANEL